MRAGAGWSDVSILNISSRGMLIHSFRTGPQGSVIELWRGERLIVARVVWREGPRAGLRTEDRIPVDEVVSLGQLPGLQLTADDCANTERQKLRRTHDDSRMRGRAFEFAGIAILAASAAAGAFAMVEQALAHPMAMIRAALG